MSWDRTNRNKYGVRTDPKGIEDRTADGITFHSKKERIRYQELKIAEKCKLIYELELQPKYPLYVRDTRLAFYVADFRYKTPKGELIVEDCKGVKTPIYQRNKKHFEAQYGIKILET